MLNSGYRRLLLPLSLAFVIPILYLGCQIDVGYARTEDEQTRDEQPDAQNESDKVVEVRIGGGKIIVDGDTLSDKEFDRRIVGDVEIISEDTGDVDEELEGIGVSRKSGDVVRFGEKIKVKEGEKVRGSVVSIGGDVVVRGVVTEDAVAIGGDVYITSTGDVQGSAVAVGGTVRREPGGRIGQDEVSLGPGWFPPMVFLKPNIMHGANFRSPFMLGAFGKTIMKVFWLGLVIMIGMGIVLLFPKQLKNVEDRIRTAPGKSGLVGFVTQILLVPLLVFAIVLLCITIVGIPLIIFVVPLYVFAVIAAFFFGYIGIASIVAKLVESRAGLDMESPYARVALGVLILMITGLVATVLGFGGGPLHFIAIMLGLVSWMILYLAATIGLGAVVMTRFGSRSHGPPTLTGTPVKPDSPTGTTPVSEPAGTEPSEPADA